MGSQHEEAILIHAPGKLAEAWEQGAHDAMFEYGHRYDGGTVFHKGQGAFRFIGQLPARWTLQRFTMLAYRQADYRAEGKWHEWKPDKRQVIVHRTCPVPKRQHADPTFMRMLNDYIKHGVNGTKHDSVITVIRPNKQEEKAIKTKNGAAGTRKVVSYVQAWVPS